MTLRDESDGLRAERVVITREPDDKLADVRISLGRKRGVGIYIVFRGDPDEVQRVLDIAAAAGIALPDAEYQDKRGRGQG